MFSSVFVPFKGPFRRFEITAPRRVEPGGLSGPSASVASADPAIDWTTSAALCTASQLSPAMGWDGQTISGSGTRKSAINRCAYIYIYVCVCVSTCISVCGLTFVSVQWETWPQEVPLWVGLSQVVQPFRSLGPTGWWLSPTPLKNMVNILLIMVNIWLIYG